MLPLRRVNQKPKNPAERIDTWAGPKLEEFFGGSAPAPKPAVEEKPAIVEKVQKAPPKPSQIIPQPNNYKQVFDDLYAKGYGVNSAEYAQQDTPEKAVAWAWQTWGDGDLIAVQMSNNKWVGFHSGGTSEARRELNQSAIVEQENVEPEEMPDSLDGFRAGLGYYEDAFNKATNGEFYGDFAGKGFSVTGVKEFAVLLQKYPGSAPALAAGFANEKAFLEAEGSPDPKDVKLVAQVEQLLGKYGVMLPPRAPKLTEWPWAEFEKEANALGWYREKGLASAEGIFLREKASGQRSVDIDRDATGLWIVYGETGKFTSASVKKAGDWLIADLKSLKEFKAGDYVGMAGSWYNHNVYRLTSPAGPGKWNVENVEHMPKHTPVSVLEEKDMVKFTDYETPEQEDARRLATTRSMQKKWLERGQWEREGLKGPADLAKYLAELKARHVPEEYLKQIEDSYGDPREDPIRHILAAGFVIRNLKQVHVRELKDWPQFVMENGEEVNVNFLNRSVTGGHAGSNSFLRDLNAKNRDEKETAKIIDHDDPVRGIKANYNAELPDGTLVRVTPPGQKTIDDLVHQGDIIQGYNGKEGPNYWVVNVHKYLEYGLPVWSLGVVDEGEAPTGAKGRYKSAQIGSMNELVAQDGIIHEFFQESDEVWPIVGHKDLPTAPSLTGRLEVEAEPDEEEPEEE